MPRFASFQGTQVWNEVAPSTGPSPYLNTTMVFYQASAPTGWVQDTTSANDSMLRVVTGAPSTGGTVAFTTAFTSAYMTPSAASQAVAGGTVNPYILTTSDIMAHVHWPNPAVQFPWGPSPGGAGTLGLVTLATTTGPGQYVNPSISTARPVTPVSGGQGHTHTGGSVTVSFTGTARNMAVKYVDSILAKRTT